MHCIDPVKEIQEAAKCISVVSEDLEFVREGLWYLPREHSETPEMRKLLEVYKQHAVRCIAPFATAVY